MRIKNAVYSLTLALATHTAGGNRSCSATTVSSFSLSARHASTAAFAAESVVMHVTRCFTASPRIFPSSGELLAAARRVDDQRDFAVLHLVDQVRPAFLRSSARPSTGMPRSAQERAPCRASRSA